MNSDATSNIARRAGLSILVAVIALSATIPLLPVVSAQPGIPQSDDTGGPTATPARAAVRLPVAAGLSCVLALRPRRRGTPHRQVHVVQTQIILSIVGAMVMLIVGASLARAFGIVGAAGLVRYRAKIEDPKDAGVMLATLAIGLASGVGLWMLAIFGTGFVLLVLSVIESVEPQTTRPFTLEIKAKDPAAFKPKVEQLLKQARWEYELRTSAQDELEYDVKVPLERKTDTLSDRIMKLDPENATAVEWKENEKKKK
jgi:uncharacterized membrane protein YhiD involved in acid resistance